MSFTNEGFGQEAPLPFAGKKTKPRALLFGGTSEARELARRIATDGRFDALVSLAGRTSEPLRQSLPVRVGGFGSVDGLIRCLEEWRIDKAIDATHPFAARISANVAAACAALRVPLIGLTRAPWRPEPGDKWIEGGDNAAAVEALGENPRRVFLTIGRLGLADYARAPQHFYLVRSIDRPSHDDLPPRHELVLARGPFDVESEIALMRTASVDVLVSKNSGGQSTYAKILAARALGLEMIVIARPRAEHIPIVHDIEQAMAFLRGDRAP